MPGVAYEEQEGTAAAGPQGSQPKIEPALNTNIQKEPDDWVFGHDRMTAAQASTSKAWNAASLRRDLTKAEA
jgi:hypothetical protein